MPSSLQTLDTAFPKIDDHQTTEENFNQVTNYLYMLLENLRYTLGNLGEENFNDTELDSIAKLIQEPIWARIADDEGNIHTLNVTAQNLLSQVSDINGNLSTLQKTASILSSRISNAEGDISSLTQTVNGFSLSVSNGESSSTIKLMSGSTVISSKTIQFTGGVVFKSDLSTAGNTTINGSNITTGTINAITIKGCTISGNTISGGTISGSRYKNAGGTTWMEVGKDYDGVDNDVFALYVSNSSYSDSETGIFSVYNGDFGYVSLDGKGYSFLTSDYESRTTRINVGDTGKYWEFSTTGIKFCDANGTVTNRVQLAN